MAILSNGKSRGLKQTGGYVSKWTQAAVVDMRGVLAEIDSFGHGACLLLPDSLVQTDRLKCTTLVMDI